MKILLACCLLILPLYAFELSDANSIFQGHAQIRWTRTVQTLQSLGNTYACPPENRDAPLDKKRVMNTYWSAVALKPQPEKDRAFEHLITLAFGDDHYFLRRYHIAAALYAGASVKAYNVLGEPALYEAALQKDDALAMLLLQNGADPNATCCNGRPILHIVRSEPLARMCIEGGAHVGARDEQYSETALHSAMNFEHDVALIALYRKHGLSPLDRAKYDPNVLFTLCKAAFYFTHAPLEKAQELLKDLTADEKIKAITSTDHLNKSALSHVNTTNLEPLRKLLLRELTRACDQLHLSVVPYLQKEIRAIFGSQNDKPD